jgi:small subunit ribosomal protein S16
LRRVGKKKTPIYHMVAADSRSARTGKFLEVVGRYEPLLKPPVIATKDERVVYWLKHGALPTETVRGLLRRSGLWLRWTLMKRGLSEARVAEEMEKWTMAQGPKRQREDERKARRGARKKAAKPAAAETAPAASAGS